MPIKFLLQNPTSSLLRLQDLNMPRSKSRSSSPRRDDRRRSRSPRRHGDDNTPRRKDAGFKWKERRRNDDAQNQDDDRRLERGYRESYRPRSPRRDRETEEKEKPADDGRKKEKKEKKDKKPAAAVPAQPMIRVFVNDRLGTKAEISCFASDNIGECPLLKLSFYNCYLLTYHPGLFKRVVAAQIGRNPHEILLKRQGERPFKDQLTLEDYGVSNGVQLDLELDTGD